jgi:hypothetical protein
MPSGFTPSRVVLALALGLMFGTVLGVIGDRVGWSRGTSLLVSAAVVVLAVLLYDRLFGFRRRRG